MHPRLTVCLRLLVALAVFGACSPAPAPTPEGATALPSAGPAPSETSIPTTPGEPGDVEMGFTSEGFPYVGNPSAPVTLVEHSEFQ